MGHSVGHENLLALAVVADGSRIADHEADRSLRSASNRSRRRDIAVGRNRKNGYRRRAHVRDIQFPQLRIEGNSRRTLDSGFGSFDDAHRSRVTFIARAEYENRIV